VITPAASGPLGHIALVHESPERAEELGLPTSPFRFAGSEQEFLAAVEQIGTPADKARARRSASTD